MAPTGNQNKLNRKAMKNNSVASVKAHDFASQKTIGGLKQISSTKDLHPIKHLRFE